MEKIKWSSGSRKICELNPAPYNPRQLTKKQAEDLTKSLNKFSLAEPVVINLNNTIIGGHQRINILKSQGIEEVDVRVPDRQLTDDEEKELNVRLNRNLGEWDFDLLANFDIDFLKDVGFEAIELDKIFDIEPAEEENPVPAPPQIARSEVGAVYTLGRHRLMCGDSTNASHVDALMQEEMADLIFTDPPYNVDYHGMQNSKQWDSIANDAMSPVVFEQFLKSVFQRMFDVSKSGAAAYICHADKSHKEFRNAFESCGYAWRATIIWVKNSPAFNFAQYKYKHEPIFYCYKNGSTVDWFGDRMQNTIWEEKKERGDHPTIKPIALILRAIQNSSKESGIVLDLFGGSGSTLIACEVSDRICRMMEIDPFYCDVIIQRYCNHTGANIEEIYGQCIRKSSDS